MNHFQELRQNGYIPATQKNFCPCDTRHRHKSASVQISSAEIYTARIMAVINPHIKRSIADSKFISIQVEIRNILQEFKRTAEEEHL